MVQNCTQVAIATLWDLGPSFEHVQTRRGFFEWVSERWVEAERRDGCWSRPALAWSFVRLQSVYCAFGLSLLTPSLNQPTTWLRWSSSDDLFYLIFWVNFFIATLNTTVIEEEDRPNLFSIQRLGKAHISTSWSSTCLGLLVGAFGRTCDGFPGYGACCVL